MEATQTVRHPQDATPPGFETVWAVEKKAEQIEEDQLKEEIAKEKKRLWDKWVGESLYFGDIADYMMRNDDKEMLFLQTVNRKNGSFFVIVPKVHLRCQPRNLWFCHCL